ncbi:MAG: FAD-binding oxidoreductase [Acidobacteriota bacterium]|nr:FAD-binding oxidoreductase [Acidobacteriota bacterium]
MPIHHMPYWLDRTSKARRPSYPPLRGNVDTTVVIVGGGLTGCACALAFATAGVKVVLLEAEAIGQGGTARGLGVVREDFDARFRDTVAAHGLAAAGTMWQGFRAASLELPAVLRRLDARCDLAPEDLLSFAPLDPDSGRALQREYKVRRDAGLRHSWLTPAAFARETALDSGGAIRTRGSKLDPYRACLALAAAARGRGATVHERSRVERIRAGQKHVEVATNAGVVRAATVLIATSAPLTDLRALRRHLKPHLDYSVLTAPVPAFVRRSMGRRTAALRKDSRPPQFLRWVAGDRVLVSGGDQAELPARAREKALVQRTGQLMYELSLLYPDISGLAAESAWDTMHYETPDHLPFAGLHRNFPRHLFAMSGGRHGAAFPWLAARVLLRSFQGAPAKGDELFGFSRVL